MRFSDGRTRGRINPNRFDTFVSDEMLASNVSIISTLIEGKFASYADSVADLPRDAARVVEFGGEKVAVYRDAQDHLHAVSAVCTHMGCIVTWNAAEKTWDCPCHGSRFDCDGHVMHAPAIDDFAAYEGRL